MASLIEALALGVVAAGALWVFERKRWGYARNLARARLVNSISIAWNAVAGRYDPNPSPVIYHFDGVTTDVGPDFKALMAPSQVLTPDKIGEARQRSRKYEYQADP
jgi:hypothetical protein